MQKARTGINSKSTSDKVNDNQFCFGSTRRYLDNDPILPSKDNIINSVRDKPVVPVDDEFLVGSALEEVPSEPEVVGFEECFGDRIFNNRF